MNRKFLLGITCAATVAGVMSAATNATAATFVGGSVNGNVDTGAAVNVGDLAGAKFQVGDKLFSNFSLALENANTTIEAAILNALNVSGRGTVADNNIGLDFSANTLASAVAGLNGKAILGFDVAVTDPNKAISGIGLDLGGTQLPNGARFRVTESVFNSAGSKVAQGNASVGTKGSSDTFINLDSPLANANIQKVINFKGAGETDLLALDNAGSNTNVNFKIGQTFQQTDVAGSEPVPEPASMLGILTFGALGGRKLLKRKKKSAEA